MKVKVMQSEVPHSEFGLHLETFQWKVKVKVRFPGWERAKEKVEVRFSVKVRAKEKWHWHVKVRLTVKERVL